jgi:thymidylate synthase (FAD)
MTFEVSAPMFVKAQWWKYVTGSMHDPMQAWNESSRRYVTDEPEFYIPQWRSAPEDKKQGSGDFLNANIEGWGNPVYWDIQFRETIERGMDLYNQALENNVAPEQARVFLPAYAMYVKWWWTCSLQGALHLIEQRTAPDAQWEFQEFARVVEYMVRMKFPVATSALLGR